MARKQAHPDELFDYLRGSLDEESSNKIEQHLANCSECSSIAALIRAVKSDVPKHSKGEPNIPLLESEVPTIKPQAPPRQHPDVSELASLFYGQLSRARIRTAAAHIAQCSHCADEIAEYARGEKIASEFTPSSAQRVDMPAAAWALIRDWEESSFAKPKPAGEVVSTDLLNRLSRLLSERREELREFETRSRPELVPVVIVTSAGEYRGVELFEPTRMAGGASSLRHSEKSERFDSRPVHALVDIAGQMSILLSDRITGDTIPIESVTRATGEWRTARYFIVED